MPDTAEVYTLAATQCREFAQALDTDPDKHLRPTTDRYLRLLATARAIAHQLPDIDEREALYAIDTRLWRSARCLLRMLADRLDTLAIEARHKAAYDLAATTPAGQCFWCQGPTRKLTDKRKMTPFCPSCAVWWHKQKDGSWQWRVYGFIYRGVLTQRPTEVQLARGKQAWQEHHESTAATENNPDAPR